MSFNELVIWRAGRYVGNLRRHQGALQLSYASAALVPVSRSLPLGCVHEGASVSHFFDSLLPPGVARTLCAQALNCPADDTLGLLGHMGADAPGGLTILPIGAAPSPGRLASIDPPELAELLGQLTALPLLAGTAGISQTLSGSRPKLGIIATAEGYALPLDGARSTHVIKPDLPPWQGAALTEVFCQQLARLAGLPASPAQLVRLGELTCSIIERYDSVGGQAVSAETFAQALGKGDQPREVQGGPSLIDCFRLIEDFATDVRAEQQVLMDFVLFNALIGNSNADSSLFVLIGADDGPRLAPLHGALCAPVFPYLQQRLALKVGQASELGELRARDALLMLRATQLEPADLVSRAADLAEALRTHSRELAKTYKDSAEARPVLATILSTLEQNSTTVMQALRGLRNRDVA
jgi:serine/threonine-protein kinase HipA